MDGDVGLLGEVEQVANLGVHDGRAADDADECGLVQDDPARQAWLAQGLALHACGYAAFNLFSGQVKPEPVITVRG